MAPKRYKAPGASSGATAALAAMTRLALSGALGSRDRPREVPMAVDRQTTVEALLRTGILRSHPHGASASEAALSMQSRLDLWRELSASAEPTQDQLAKW